jgi:regulator of protease activity HflC (stomatin/prohibitin superfamily)
MPSSWDEEGVNAEGMTPAALVAHRRSLPRFQRASNHATILGRVLLVLILCSGVLWWLTSSAPAALLLWQPLLVTYLASLLVLMAAIYSVWWISCWRIQAVKELPPSDITDIAIPKAGRTWLPSRISPFLSAIGQLLRSFFYLHAGLIGVSLLAFFSLLLAINKPVPDLTAIVEASSGMAFANVPLTLLLVVTLLVLAFVMLVLERFYAANRSKELPESPVLVCYLRLGITISLLLSVAIPLVDSEWQWPLWLISGLVFLPAAIAVELLLRAVLSVFAPQNSQVEPELLATSLIVAMWRWPFEPFQHFQNELKERFGIDLRQSWAFAYMRSALLPVVAGLLGVAWLFSGLREIGIAERGIYERFGNPVEVWQSGLHPGLPWPLGRVIKVEKGVVHELATASVSDEPSQLQTEVILLSVEESAPASANRLWDASHLAEKSQIIASEIRTPDGIRQSFHIVNMDVRLMYRIGLSDEAALKAAYQNADLPALIRSTANRILVRYFASRTLEGVLGEARQQLALEIGAQLQADLDELNSGVEIMATVLEAIHPPAAAANAYHSVQAAQITASAIVARERGNAAQTVNVAQVRATIAQDQASATARETLAKAEVTERRFNAEQLAYQQGGKAFLWEEYYAQLVQGLSKIPFTLVDHRLDKTRATVDLRRFASSDLVSGSATNPPDTGRATDFGE